MDMNKRALMALVVIGVVTFSACGVVGLSATRASAATCSWREAPTTGIVGQELSFSLQSGKPFPQGLQFRFDGEGTITDIAIPVTGLGVLDESILTYKTTFAFPRAGSYTVSVWAAENDPGCTALTIIITPITKLELTGPTTGTVGDALNYTVKAQECDAAGTCKPPTPMMVDIDVHGSSVINYTRSEHLFGAQTDAQGIATIVVPFTTAGEYHLLAGSTDFMRYLSNQLVVTIAAGGGTGSGSGGDSAATSTSTANATALNQTSSAATSSSLTPGFEFIGALAGLVLVALFMVNKRYR